MKVMINDVKRADFHARATRDVYVELPDEDQRPGQGDLVGKLDRAYMGPGMLRAIGRRQWPSIWSHADFSAVARTHVCSITRCGTS